MSISVSPLEEAVALHKQGALNEAAQVYQGILTQDPHQADALHLLGVIAHQQGDSARAVELINRAMGLRPSTAAFHANLAEAYRALRQLNRAVGCCRTALRLDPNQAEAANHLGLALLELGQPEAARDAFQTALRLNFPSSPWRAITWPTPGGFWATRTGPSVIFARR